MSERFIAPESFLKPEYTIAVVHASNDRMKRGFEVYAALKTAGLNVYPVNPHERQIQGDACFPNLTQLRPFADVVILTVSYDEDEYTGMEILQEMRDLNIYRAWAEPHCDTKEMRVFATDAHIELLTEYRVQDVVVSL